MRRKDDNTLVAINFCCTEYQAVAFWSSECVTVFSSDRILRRYFVSIFIFFLLTFCCYMNLMPFICDYRISLGMGG